MDTKKATAELLSAIHEIAQGCSVANNAGYGPKTIKNIYFKFEMWSKLRKPCEEILNKCVENNKVYEYDDIIFNVDSYEKDLSDSIISIIIAKDGKVPETIPVYKKGNVSALLEDTSYLYESVYGYVDGDALKRYTSAEYAGDLYKRLPEGEAILRLRRMLNCGEFFKYSYITQANCSIHYRDIEHLRWGIDGPKYRYKTETDIKFRFNTLKP